MLGWLHATPEKRKETRWQDYVSRNKDQPPMPEVECAEHLLDYLQDVGPAYNNGMGQAPLPFFEIKAWSDMTSTPLTPWEAHTIRMLSEAYVGSMNQGSKANCAPPWTPKTGFDKQAIASGMKGLLGKINQKRNKRG